MSKKILSLILPVAVALPGLVFGQTLGSMADAAEQTTLYVASAIVVILWVVTGILFLSASGAPEKLKSAKTALFAAIAGTILVIVAEGAMNLIKVALKI